MAKIALIVKHIGPQVLSMAKSLAAQRNDVYFITSSKAKMPEQIPFPVLTPFRNWSFSEALILFPRLLSSMPDVMHFIFSEPSEQPTRADWLLSRLIQPIPRKAVTASFFYSPKEVSSLRLREFLKACHAVTWGSHIHLLQAKRSRSVPNRSLVEVIPPVMDRPDAAKTPPNPDLKRLVAALGNFILVPGGPEEFFQRADKSEMFFDQKINFLFMSERRSVRNRYPDCYYLNSQSPEDLLYALENARAVLLAFNDHSVIELQNYFQWSRWSKTPLIIRPEQNSVFPGLVLDQKTGWILESGERSLRSLIRRNPELRLPQKPDENPSFQLMDTATNQLNRLFASAISLRS